MNGPYANELRALKRSGRYRERRLADESLIDAASNDYLGLAHEKGLHELACHTVASYAYHAPKASMLVGGYHPIHAAFEKALCEANGFESAIVMGNGFNANVGLIEALVRKGDLLLIDEEYHASGIVATRMCEGEVVFFPHNDVVAFETLLQRGEGRRIIVAVEGIYSMGGDRVEREILESAMKHDCVLIIDEAHSSGVIGPNLMGILDHYGITPSVNTVKMGTLGKAYGSFGAYVLSSGHICDYLINRGKNVIYATAPSLYDTALAHHALEYILAHARELRDAVDRRQRIVREMLGIEVGGLIVPITVGDNREVMRIKEEIETQMGISVGAIRQPTVKKAIIRLIARLELSEETLVRLCERFSAFKVQ
ncbi:MAG: aminotransferase class I/II-fold pyridoxal phosphate-dependent enzyme [Sulfuricurvum sp.]